ncbi:MAG TPA: hypothetical protein VIK53_13090 [Verrucomicrobiae bacterium]
MSGNTPIQKTVVEVDTSTLEKSSHGSITGVIRIQIDNVSFPDTRWNDFPVVILSWWLEPVCRIMQGKTRIWGCKFMDGPVTVRLEQQHDDTWTLRCFHGDRVEFTATTSCRAFINSLLDAARQILRECQRRGWQSRDIEILDSAVRTIQREMA